MKKIGMKKIGFEEHFFTPGHLKYLRAHKGYPRLETVQDEKHGKVDCLMRMPGSSQVIWPQLMERLLDVGKGRIAEMDRNGIDMQVLSMAGPGVEELDPAHATALARSINNELAESIQAHPDRFVGLATLAYGDPHAAADELERAVTRLGFKGGKINSHVGGEYLDHRKYWSFWERAEKLGVPVMLHPKDPPPGMLSALDTYPGLTQAGWGFALDAGTHALRLICSGLFDAHPNLKIILGHLGEAIPFWMARIDNHWVRSPGSRIKRLPSEYFRQNFVVTTSGMFHHPQFQCTYQILGADQICFAVDYPYESMPDGSRFIDEVSVSEADRDKICHANAEKLLGL